MAIVPSIAVPVVRILEVGRKAYGLSKDLEKYPWLTGKIVPFHAHPDDQTRLVVDKVVRIAEEKLADLQNRLREY
jgi:hypothetical protein